MTDEEYMAMSKRLDKAWNIQTNIKNMERMINVINEAPNYEFNICDKSLLPYCDNDLVEDFRHKIIAHLEGKITLLKQEFKEL